MEPNTEILETKVELISQESLSLITKAEIDTQISTAKAFPRSIGVFLSKALSMVSVNESIAASCSYSLPRAGKTIDGPSVRLAEIVMSCFGNIRAGARIISNDGKSVTAQGICHDLESNVCVTVEVKRKITDRNGRTYTEDMQIVTGNAACAIALRNAIFKVVPAALCQDLLEKAREVARGTLATLEKRRASAIEFFKGKGVTEAQILTVLEVKKIEDIDLDKLQILSGFKTAITNNESTVKEIFTHSADAITKEMLTEMLAKKKITLKVGDVKRIQEIIDNNEVASFSKAHEMLK